jgi:hypothetical protein
MGKLVSLYSITAVGHSPTLGMLMIDLQRYLEEIVDPTVKDFKSNPDSRRHAFLACVAACHAVDYLAHPKKPHGRRAQFIKESRAFAVVNDVGHAFKHVVQGPRHEPRMRQAEVISRPAAR